MVPNRNNFQSFVHIMLCCFNTVKLWAGVDSIVLDFWNLKANQWNLLKRWNLVVLTPKLLELRIVNDSSLQFTELPCVTMFDLVEYKGSLLIYGCKRNVFFSESRREADTKLWDRLFHLNSSDIWNRVNYYGFLVYFCTKRMSRKF